MRYDPHLNPRRLFVVGVGGTGSHVAMTVGRMLYDMQQRGLDVPKLILVDPDIVETKNVGRQMFVPQDVGQPKAAVLARRLSFMLGIDVTYHHKPVNAEMLKNKHYGMSTVLVGCVDGHEGRAVMNQADAVWVDAGNRYDSGQVVIGDTRNNTPLDPGCWREDEGVVTKLPTAADWHPELLEPESEDAAPTASCADLTQRGEQHLLINSMIAQVASNYVYKLLHQLPITSYETVVDLELEVMQSKPITREAFE